LELQGGARATNPTAPAPTYELSFKAGAGVQRGALRKVAAGVTHWDGPLDAGVDRVAVRAAVRNSTGASSTSAWSVDSVFPR
jgi:hypothetical protein